MIMSQMRDRQGRTNTEGQGQADTERPRKRQAGRQTESDRQTETEANNLGKLLSFLNCFALNSWRHS